MVRNNVEYMIPTLQQKQVERNGNVPLNVMVTVKLKVI